MKRDEVHCGATSRGSVPLQRAARVTLASVCSSALDACTRSLEKTCRDLRTKRVHPEGNKKKHQRLRVIESKKVIKEKTTTSRIKDIDAMTPTLHAQRGDVHHVREHGA